jgi:predicted transcriptional regulator
MAKNAVNNAAKQDVTDAELAVMEVLWGAPATIRGIRDKLYPRGGLAHYNTVQKLLERLEAKGYIDRDTQELAHRFTAAVGREELVGRRLRAMADELCGGSLATLLTGLVRSQPLKPAEIRELRELIDRADRTDRSRKRK